MNAVLPSATVVCFGEMLVRLTPPDRQLLLQANSFTAHVGGAEANVAVSLSKLGHRARMVTALPDNDLGRACLGELRRHGVETSFVRLTEGRMGLYFMAQGAGPRASEVLYDRRHSAFAEARPDLFDWGDVLDDASWLHVSGITPAVSDDAGKAALRAVSMARQRGVKVSFDCNFRARVWAERAPRAPGILRALCAQADLLFGDERDIAFILGIALRGRDAADAAFQAFTHLEWIAATQRTRHSVDLQELSGQLFGPGLQWSTPAWTLSGIVDRIGAGDAFAAGLLHGLITGMSPQSSIDFATVAACLKHTVPGDFNPLGVADIELALADRGADVRR